MACCRGLAPSMYPGLISESKLAAFAAISEVIPAGIKLLAGLVRSMAPIENWVILASEPVGVHEVSAIEFVAMTARMAISGKEMKASNQGTPKNQCETPAPNTQKIGTPTADSHKGSSIFLSTSTPASRPRRLAST